MISIKSLDPPVNIHSWLFALVTGRHHILLRPLFCKFSKRTAQKTNKKRYFRPIHKVEFSSDATLADLANKLKIDLTDAKPVAQRPSMNTRTHSQHIPFKKCPKNDQSLLGNL